MSLCYYEYRYIYSIVVSISACHAGDPGSSPGCGVVPRRLVSVQFLFVVFVMFNLLCPEGLRASAATRVTGRRVLPTRACAVAGLLKTAGGHLLKCRSLVLCFLLFSTLLFLFFLVWPTAATPLPLAFQVPVQQDPHLAPDQAC